MSVRRLAYLAMVSTLLLSSCDHTAVPPQGNQGASVAQSLPRNVASPPETINMPRRFPASPPIRASWRRSLIDLTSNARGWKGRMVSVYYVPPQNTSLERGTYVLQSTMNIQKVAESTLRPDGSWTATWDTKGYALPGDRVFLLIRTDEGQKALVQLPKRTP